MVTDLLDDDGLLDIGRKRSTDPGRAVAEERGKWQEAPEQNAELASWAKQAAPSKDGACHVCQRPARGACGSCGRPACSSHSWVMLGVCRACATEDRMQRWHHERAAGQDNWLEEA